MLTDMAIKSFIRKKGNLATQRKIWHQVKAPTAWRPKPNDELIGTYLSTEVRVGKFGEYKIHLIQSRGKIYYVSGTHRQMNYLD